MNDRYSQPRRYTCLLNSFSDYRASKCLGCQRPTFERKFPLFIHIEGSSPTILGKTCKYCARCEIIVVDQLDVAAQLSLITNRPVEELDWLVLGTVDKRIWMRQLGGGPTPTDIPKVLVRFKEIREVRHGSRSKLSDAARAARAPRPPEELVGALQDRIHPTSGHLLCAKPIARTRRK